jgi:hypothetical protein
MLKRLKMHLNRSKMGSRTADKLTLDDARNGIKMVKQHSLFAKADIRQPVSTKLT